MVREVLQVFLLLAMGYIYISIYFLWPLWWLLSAERIWRERKNGQIGKGISFFAFWLRSTVGVEGRGREYIAMRLRIDFLERALGSYANWLMNYTILFFQFYLLLSSPWRYWLPSGQLYYKVLSLPSESTCQNIAWDCNANVPFHVLRWSLNLLIRENCYFIFDLDYCYPLPYLRWWFFLCQYNDIYWDSYIVLPVSVVGWSCFLLIPRRMINLSCTVKFRLLLLVLIRDTVWNSSGSNREAEEAWAFKILNFLA